MIKKLNQMKGFTLVELLIVIALIAILSVAVLATINPIEQSNKARDARVQNDAAEVMNAYERYYASLQRYPWMDFTGVATANNDGAVNTAYTDTMLVMLRSDQFGFGICNGGGAGLSAQDADAVATDCDASDANPNYLISTSELKSSFAGKDEFEPVRSGDNIEQALWVAKEANANSIYVCYIPKANANRVNSSLLRCLDTDGTVTPYEGTGVGECGSGVVADWAVPVFGTTVAMYRCVPE